MRDIVLITGASSDIGLALLRDLAEGGRPAFDDTILAHTHTGEARLNALVEAVPALAGRVQILPADLGSPDDVAGLIEAVRTRHGHPTHIVHLAAKRLKLTRATAFDWPALVADLHVQVHALSALAAAFVPAMVHSGRRCKIVVMLSSVTMSAPPKFMAEYVVAKYALLGLCRALAAEFVDKPICVNAVSPSMIDTQFLAELPARYVEQAAAAHPARRNATTADVVPAIRFLMSAESDYISGTNLPITAGSVV